MRKSSLFFLFLLLTFPVLAQKSSVIVLEDVVLQTSLLKEYSNSQQVRTFQDSILKKAKPSLTELLNFQTPIYFKENGAGMVSSASFRGTTAAHTAVVWNGININSKFNGQTDFNTILIGGFDEIAVRKGGGSVLFGTGAIGGSINLINKFQFGKALENELSLNYGSFNTFNLNYQLQASTERTSMKIVLSRSGSDNDFSYPDSKRKNLNGNYYHNGLQANFAIQLDGENTLKFHSALFDGERHLSLIRPTENRTKYKNLHAWNMLVWDGNFEKFTSKLKLVHLTEEFKFFENLHDKADYYGESQQIIADYQFGMKIKNNIHFTFLTNYSQTKGEGTSIDRHTQKEFSVGGLWKQRLSSRFNYELGISKDFTAEYSTPVLFSLGSAFAATDFYELKINFSKNYRIPSFNDLYYENSGNTNLRPETSYQMELGNKFKVGNLGFSVTGFYILMDDMIRWVPAANGLWKPKNTAEVRSKGLELEMDYHKNFGRHRFSMAANYAYTASEDGETGKQLTYVPFHKGTAHLSYAFEKWQGFYGVLFTGKVFTHTDNDPESIVEKYWVSNLGISRSLGNSGQFEVGGKVLNLFNKEYESVENRIFPGRNFQIFVRAEF